MGPWWNVLFFYGHGQVSISLFDAITAECTEEGLKTGEGLSDTCNELLGDMYGSIGGYYDYNLYDDCTYENDLRRNRRRLTNAAPWAKNGASTVFNVVGDAGAIAGGALNDYPCGGGGATDAWARSPKVMEALHVPADSNFFSGDNGVGMTCVGHLLARGLCHPTRMSFARFLSFFILSAVT